MQTDTEGLVLRQVKTADGRRMLLLFTRKYGKISVGTGLSERSTRSRAALSIRPFTYGRYELYKGREYYNLNSGEVLKSYYSLGEDLDKYMAASVCLELTEKLIPEDVPEPRVFSLLLDLLTALSNAPAGEKGRPVCETLTLAYRVKLLAELGSMPVLESCARCGGALGERPAFSVKDGGMICGSCAEKTENEPQKPGKETLIYRPGFDIVKVMGYFVKKPLSAFEKVTLNEDTAKELRTILHEYMAYHLDLRPLKSENMLEL
ncbi:MAG: DNA repair protein RecO [Clostridia bacterium]|nr:DNA repair protein RecO [Clostridia bacterium]